MTSCGWRSTGTCGLTRVACQDFQFRINVSTCPLWSNLNNLNHYCLQHPASPVLKSSVNCGSRSIRSLVTRFTALCAYDCCFSFRVSDPWLFSASTRHSLQGFHTWIWHDCTIYSEFRSLHNCKSILSRRSIFYYSQLGVCGTIDTID